MLESLKECMNSECVMNELREIRNGHVSFRNDRIPVSNLFPWCSSLGQSGLDGSRLWPSKALLI